MSTRFDLIVAGLGAFGSAAARAGARRGARVLALDPLAPPHTVGSSHGRTRIIREAYFEGPFYVPLVRDARKEWEALEAEHGEELFQRTGALVLGPAEGELVAGTLASARAHDLEHELVDGPTAGRRFPGIRFPEAAMGVFEPEAGVLLVEPCVRALLSSATAAGASLRLGERLLEWRPSTAGVEVRTTGGTFEAPALVLALGAWLEPQLGAGLPLPLQVERKVVHWFGPSEEPRRSEQSRPSGEGSGSTERATEASGIAPGPVTLWEYAPGRLFYTIPDLGHGTKAALHHEDASAGHDELLRGPALGDPALAEENAVRSLMARHIPGANGPVLERSVCLYTNSPDRHLVVGAHPGCSGVILAGAGSGHGFKFAPAIGEIAVELALEGRSARAPAELSPSRFLPNGGPA